MFLYDDSYKLLSGAFFLTEVRLAYTDEEEEMTQTSKESKAHKYFILTIYLIEENISVLWIVLQGKKNAKSL